MSRRACSVFAAALLVALFARAEEKKEPGISFGPNLPSFLTLPSGHSYTVLQMGPAIGREGKVLGWQIPFLTTTADPGELEAAARELVESARADPQTKGFSAIAALAVLSFDPETGRSAHYGIIFKENPTGWEQTNRIEKVPPPSPEISKLLAGWKGFTRNQRAEASGAKVAAEWLRLLDAGDFDRAWSQASPLLRAIIPRATWEAQTKTLLGRPKVSSRVETSRLYTAYGMKLPPATYLAVCFKTKRAGQEEPVLERVQLRLEEDGEWRAIGFASS